MTARHGALTPRQAQILTMYATGQVVRGKQAAHILGIDVHTVHNHLHRAAVRLGTNSVTQAVVVALQQGLLDIDLEGTPTARSGDIAPTSQSGVGRHQHDACPSCGARIPPRMPPSPPLSTEGQAA